MLISMGGMVSTVHHDDHQDDRDSHKDDQDGHQQCPNC